MIEKIGCQTTYPCAALTVGVFAASALACTLFLINSKYIDANTFAYGCIGGFSVAAVGAGLAYCAGKNMFFRNENVDEEKGLSVSEKFYLLNTIN